METWTIIGFMASVLSAATYLPEVRKALKSGHLRDVSWGMLMLSFTSSLLWLCYGMKYSIAPIILSSTINNCLSGFLIFLKVKFQESETVPDQEI